MRPIFRHMFTASAGCICCTAIEAQIVITDAGFEGLRRTVSSPSLGGTTTGSIGAWTVSVGSVAGRTATVSSGDLLGGPLPPEGNYDVKFSTPAGLGSNVSISQSLSTPLSANTLYSLSVWVSAGSTVSLLNSGSLQLRAGGNTVASLSGTSLTSLLNPSGSFSRVTLQYQTGSIPVAGNLGVYFGASSLAALSGNVYLDNFNLSAMPLTVSTVPEPEGYALASGVLLAACALLHKRHATRP